MVSTWPGAAPMADVGSRCTPSWTNRPISVRWVEIRNRTAPRDGAIGSKRVRGLFILKQPVSAVARNLLSTRRSSHCLARGGVANDSTSLGDSNEQNDEAAFWRRPAWAARWSASAADVAGNVTLAYRIIASAVFRRTTASFRRRFRAASILSTDMGFYVGTWASNVNFSGGSIETDVYGGFKGSINEDLAYDVGILYYGYPQDGSVAPGLHGVLHEPVGLRRESRRELFG